MAMNRRKMLQSMLVAGAAPVFTPGCLASTTVKKKHARVIVIGGGFAGATAAKYLKIWSPHLEVILVERNPVFISCPQSNLVLSGGRTIQQLTHDYHQLQSNYGIRVVQASVTQINSEKRSIQLHDGVRLNYEKLVIAPGIELDYQTIPMLTPDVINEKIPHAWKAGSQTTLLKRQLVSMRTGGTMVMSIPSAPFRCPPGPYERACQIAFYLKHHNPTAKLIILDANGGIISKKALFEHAWAKHYQGLIDYYPSNAVESVNVGEMSVESVFDRFEADVINIIPAQKAGAVAALAGVVNIDQRWCAVDFRTYESTAVQHVHVIGDAVASMMPKSGHIANMQAKVCAAAIVDLLNDQTPEQTPVFGNTCYSFVSDNEAGHVAAVFRYDEKQANMIAMPGGGASTEGSETDARFAQAWAKNIWSDTLT